MALLDSLGAVPSSERTLRAWDLPKEQNYFPLLPKILGERRIGCGRRLSKSYVVTPAQ